MIIILIFKQLLKLLNNFLEFLHILKAFKQIFEVFKQILKHVNVPSFVTIFQILEEIYIQF
jgi:hypothetical protein